MFQKNFKKKKKYTFTYSFLQLNTLLLTFVVILLVWVFDQKQFSKSMEAGIWRSFYKPKETARYPNYYLAKIRKKEKNNRKEKEVS